MCMVISLCGRWVIEFAAINFILFFILIGFGAWLGFVEWVATRELGGVAIPGAKFHAGGLDLQDGGS